MVDYIWIFAHLWDDKITELTEPAPRLNFANRLFAFHSIHANEKQKLKASQVPRRARWFLRFHRSTSEQKMCVPSSGSSDRKKAELRNTDPVSPPQQVPMGLKATVKSSQKDLWTFVFDSFLSKLSREVAVRPSSSSFMRIWWLSAAKHAGAKKSAALTGRRRSHSKGNSGTGQLVSLYDGGSIIRPCRRFQALMASVAAQRLKVKIHEK